MAIRNYLVEGVSGTGKSSVCEELRSRGYPAIDGDTELAYPGDPVTGDRVNVHSHQTHIWDVDKVKEIASNKSQAVAFFCGGSRNFSKFISLFDRVFVLNADDETIKHRLKQRKDATFGKKPEEIELIVRLNKTKEDIPTEATIINATQSIGAVTDDIIKYVEEDRSTRQPGYRSTL